MTDAFAVRANVTTDCRLVKLASVQTMPNFKSESESASNLFVLLRTPEVWQNPRRPVK